MTPSLSNGTATAPEAIGHSVQVSGRDLAQLLRFDARGALEGATFTTRRIAEGEKLYRAGDEFHSLYVVRSGFLKTVILDPSGAEQVLGFPMRADVLGADGIESGRYTLDAVALEATEVIALPFASLATLARETPALERFIYRMLSRELVREQGLLYIIGSLGAEGRVAAFLLNLSERFGTIGYSRSSFILRMTRQEIGSYLGLKLETVSRALSAFDAAGLINVRLKAIEILDFTALRQVMEDPGATTQKSSNGTRATPARRAAKSPEILPPAALRPRMAM